MTECFGRRQCCKSKAKTGAMARSLHIVNERLALIFNAAIAVLATSKTKKKQPEGCSKFRFRDFLNPGASAHADETKKH